MRIAIKVEKRVAITLWYLATCSESRTIGHLFGISRSTVCLIVHDTCRAIVTVMQKKYINLQAHDERCAEIARGFQLR